MQLYAAKPAKLTDIVLEYSCFTHKTAQQVILYVAAQNFYLVSKPILPKVLNLLLTVKKKKVGSRTVYKNITSCKHLKQEVIIYVLQQFPLLGNIILTGATELVGNVSL